MSAHDYIYMMLHVQPMQTDRFNYPDFLSVMTMTLLSANNW